MKMRMTRVLDARSRLDAGAGHKRAGWTRFMGRSLAILAGIAQGGCASNPDSISARYVSPNMYQNWSCDQLIDEKMRLTKEVQRISGLQRENANADVAMMTVGLIIFWPALIGLAATKDRKDELGQLKGEHDAVDLSVRSKQCMMPALGVPSTPATPIAQPATPVAQTDVTLAAATGTYKGRGKTDSWCQTPSMTLALRGTTVEGELSEVSSGNATSSITGTMDYAGVLTLDFKGTKSEYFTGRIDGALKGNTLTVDIRTKAANSCSYHFELRKG